MSPASHPLCDAARSGLFRCDPACLPTLVDTAAGHGLVTWHLDLAALPDEASLLAALAHELQFPAWFGHNRDALADCLLDLSWREARGYLLVLSHFQALQTRLPDSGAMLLDVLAHSAGIWAADGVPFWVLFGEGAPATLPVLALAA